MSTAALVLDVAVPALPGARCIGRHDLFDAPAPGTDPDTAGRRQTAALELCRRCEP